MQKNETFIAKCTGYTDDGAGVVRLDGFIFFVPGLIIDETAEIGITAVRKNFGYGRIVKLIEPSKDRVEPKCSVFKQCGGCQLQHMNRSAQNVFKEDKVKNCFRQNAGMDVEIHPILTTEEQECYRNKVQIPVQFKDGKVQMGFYRNRTNEIVEYQYCTVQTDLSNELTSFFRNAFRRYGCVKEIRHVLIKHAHITGEVMVCLIVRNYPFHNSEKLIQELQKKYPQITSCSVIVNRKEGNVILDGNEYLVYGRPYIREKLLDCVFRIHAKSFYQINPYATAVLYQKAIEYAGLSSRETVVDLYCGTGTIGLLCARHAKKVYGIEIVADAVKDAKINAEENNIDNIEFFNMDASKGAQAILKSKIKADVVIVDPPRKGCSKETLDAIIKISPQRLVYVSCDPSTLARDVRILSENGYQLKEVSPVDLFPGTVHVETVVLMSKES